MLSFGLLGRFTRFRFWLNPLPKVKVCLAGSLVLGSDETDSQMLSSEDCSAESLPFQALIKFVTECQALKAVWHGNSIQVLVKVFQMSSSEDGLVAQVLARSD